MHAWVALANRIRALRPVWSNWQVERDRLALWLPVFMGAGVLSYYGLRFEPPLFFGPLVLVCATVAALAARQLSVVRITLVPIVALALGFSAGQIATARAPPLLTELPTHATVVTGVIRSVEALPEGRRITLEAAHLDGSDVPLVRMVRLRLRATDHALLGTGDTVRIRGLIRPPSPPSYPGGWDQQRDAWYSGLGRPAMRWGRPKC